MLVSPTKYFHEAYAVQRQPIQPGITVFNHILANMDVERSTGWMQLSMIINSENTFILIVHKVVRNGTKMRLSLFFVQFHNR